MCRKHAGKTYDQLVNECETFDPVTAAKNYNFDMWLSTDPISKQFTAAITEMRRLVFAVLPDHASRHLKWWKEQCETHGRTFKAYCTDPPYVLSLWATSCKRSHNKVQNFWARIEALLEDFVPENVAHAAGGDSLDHFLDQPFARPGRVCMGITDSTFVGYGLSRYSPAQAKRWDEAKVCDSTKGWKHETVGDWLDTLMKSDLWPSPNWSFVHKWHGVAR